MPKSQRCGQENPGNLKIPRNYFKIPQNPQNVKNQINDFKIPENSKRI